jgi:hypothetical protein
MERLEYVVTEFHGPNSKCRGSVADLLLDAHLIPPCGLIPPFRVVAAVLLTGGSSGGMSPGCIWEPFTLFEDQYWQAIEHLERLTPEDLKSRHRDLQIVGEIQPDYAAPDNRQLCGLVGVTNPKGISKRPEENLHVALPSLIPSISKRPLVL